MVDVQTLAEVEDVARARLKTTLPEVRRSLKLIGRGMAYACETDKERRRARLSAKALSAGLNADRFAEKARNAIDFVGVSFLELARVQANAVCRIAKLNGSHEGTGFLVAPGLMLTNSHVIPSPARAVELQIQFMFENDVRGSPRPITAFALDPATCFVTSPVSELDFTLIAVGARREGIGSISDFGHIPLSDAADKHMLGETANIIQHPAGRLKEMVLRENRIVARDDTAIALHYTTDTENGSSGSPVFNDEWRLVALHHFGMPRRETVGISGQALSKDVNEGIRISAIVAALRIELEKPTAPTLLKDAFLLWDGGAESGSGFGLLAENWTQARPANPQISTRQNPDGSITITYAMEVTCKAASLV